MCRLSPPPVSVPSARRRTRAHVCPVLQHTSTSPRPGLSCTTLHARGGASYTRIYRLSRVPPSEAILRPAPARITTLLGKWQQARVPFDNLGHIRLVRFSSAHPLIPESGETRDDIAIHRQDEKNPEDERDHGGNVTVHHDKAEWYCDLRRGSRVESFSERARNGERMRVTYIRSP